jgi:exonuclease III
LSKHIFLCPAYIIPASSSYIFQSDVDVLDSIDKYIVNQYAEKGHSVLYGDFNARTGSEFDYIESDIFDPYTIDEKEYEYDILLQKRKGCDNNVDVRGKQLLQMCISLKVRIVNGRILGDSNGNFTCFKYNGTSVVDYIIMSEDLIKQTLKVRILFEFGRLEFER